MLTDERTTGGSKMPRSMILFRSRSARAVQARSPCASVARCARPARSWSIEVPESPALSSHAGRSDVGDSTESFRRCDLARNPKSPKRTNLAELVGAARRGSGPPVSSKDGRTSLLGPGGAADNSPGREPWGENRSNTPLSPRQGATEQHMHDSVVPPGLKHLTSIVSNPGLAPGAIIDRPLTGASDALIADHPFAASSRIRSAQSCHPSHQPSFLSWTRLDQCERTDWQVAIGTVASVHRLDRI